MSRSYIIPLAFAPLLAACATTGNIKGDFQCAAPGGTCAPMSVIDAAAVSSMGNNRSPMGISDQVQIPRPLAGPFLTDGSAPPRTSDRVLRVVFPAHIDADGIYREESAAHAVVENAAWAEALGGRSASARGTPALRTSGIGVEQPAPSALATLDEVVAARAARSGHLSPTGGEQTSIGAVAPVAVSSQPEPQRFEPVSSWSGFSSRSSSPQSLAEAAAGLSAPALPALDPRSPAANYDTPDVTAVRTAAAPGPLIPVVPRVKPAATDTHASVGVVADAAAPYGTRPVRWKGRTYDVPFKNPQPGAASSQRQPNATAELNKAALAKAAIDRPNPQMAATVSPPEPTHDARVAMARVRAMAAPVIAAGVEKGREEAALAVPEGFSLPIASVASVPK